MRPVLLPIVALGAAVLAALAYAWADKPQPSTQPTTQRSDMNTLKATFGAGCFWGVEATFRKAPGVVDVAVGYSGGHKERPSYKEVCTDRTGHAEVVEVTYDPERISYDRLLKIFFAMHDPTQVNRQGPDVGSQYRSVVFYHSGEQKAAAEAMKAALGKSGKFRRPIATHIEPAQTFWRAEDYHQRYLEKNGLDNCHLPVDLDKLD